MTSDKAVELVKEMGHIFSVALAEMGHKLETESDLMTGLVGYYALDLEGENEHFDKAVDTVMQVVYEGAKEKLKQLEGGRE